MIIRENYFIEDSINYFYSKSEPKKFVDLIRSTYGYEETLEIIKSWSN